MTDAISVRLAARARLGSKVGQAFLASADDDVNGANNVVRMTGRVIGVGDSDILRTGRRLIAGRARGGRGPFERRATVRQPRRRRDPSARLGLPLAGLEALRAVPQRRRGTCRPAKWLGADGKRSWRLALRGQLPPGSYEVLSRARIRAGVREGRFSASGPDARSLPGRLDGDSARSCGESGGGVAGRPGRLLQRRIKEGRG